MEGKCSKVERKGSKLYPYEECRGFRKGSSLLYVPQTQQLYVLKSKTKVARRYICYNKSCPRSVVVDFANDSMCRVPGGSGGDLHNHPTQEITYQNMKLANTIKDRCADMTLQKGEVRKIFEEECSKNEAEVIDLQFKRMQRQLLNIRNTALPKCPENSAEICEIFECANIMKNFGMSRYNKTARFYQDTVIEEQFSYSIFMSPAIADRIKGLSCAKNYVMDIIFSAVPICGYQHLLIVYFCYEEHVYPFLYVLTSSKDEECYRHVFTNIESNLFKFEGNCFVIDFKECLESALQMVFPSTVLNTSWFHFCCAVRRRAAEIPEINHKINLNLETKAIYKKLLAIPLLEPTTISSGYEILKIKANRLGQFNPFHELFQYFENEWMQKKVPFPWAVNKSTISTTIELETLNSKFGRQLSKSGGNFVKFISSLLDKDLIQSRELFGSQDETLDVDSSPKKKCKDGSTIIEDLRDKLKRKKISIDDFLQQITDSKNSIGIFDNMAIFDDKLVKYIKEEPSSDTDNSNIENIVCKPDIPEPVLICTMCNKNPRTILVQPCNHFKLCSTCFEHIAEKYAKQSTPMLCPTCKQIVKNSTIIFT